MPGRTARLIGSAGADTAGRVDDKDKTGATTLFIAAPGTGTTNGAQTAELAAELDRERDGNMNEARNLLLGSAAGALWLTVGGVAGH